MVRRVLAGYCASNPAPTGSRILISTCQSNMPSYLDFEKPVAEIEAKLAEFRALEARGDGVSFAAEADKLGTKAEQTLRSIYTALTPWQKTQVARHPQRPHFVDYCATLFTEFTPLAGDRKFAEDEAIISGLGRFQGQAVAIRLHHRSAHQAQFRHGTS
jgi:acetyl-CoA carboxylase carboxyl transferase subunit alpha